MKKLKKKDIVDFLFVEVKPGDWWRIPLVWFSAILIMILLFWIITEGALWFRQIELNNNRPY